MQYCDNREIRRELYEAYVTPRFCAVTKRRPVGTTAR